MESLGTPQTPLDQGAERDLGEGIEARRRLFTTEQGTFKPKGKEGSGRAWVAAQSEDRQVWGTPRVQLEGGMEMRVSGAACPWDGSLLSFSLD